MARASRIDCEKWTEARAMREAGATISYVAEWLGIARSFVSRKARDENWGDPSDLASTIARKVTEKGYGIETGVSPAQKAISIEASSSKIAAVVDQQRAKWPEIEAAADKAYLVSRMVQADDQGADRAPDEVFRQQQPLWPRLLPPAVLQRPHAPGTAIVRSRPGLGAGQTVQDGGSRCGPARQRDRRAFGPADGGVQNAPVLQTRKPSPAPLLSAPDWLQPGAHLGHSWEDWTFPPLWVSRGHLGHRRGAPPPCPPARQASAPYCPLKAEGPRVLPAFEQP